MAKSSTNFVCQNCGAAQPKWSGQCPSCGEWNTLVETLVQPAMTASGGGGHRQKPIDPQNIVSLSQVDLTKRPKSRVSSGIGELDRVLGGGIVPGAVMLLGGEPGIGKSTLLTQLVVKQLQVQSESLNRPESDPKSVAPIMYIAGEESPSQIALRINRLLENDDKKTSKKSSSKSGQTWAEQLVFVTTTDVDEIATAVREVQPSLLIVDSIQTLQTTDLTGSEGSVGQLRESTQRITELAKSLHTPVFLVGHVTKEGTIAGPKVLEHIVDSVLELSGERTGQLRLLRAIKNRFGATDEVGVFSLMEVGLMEVTNPSELFLEHTNQPVPGSATVGVMEGTRPLLAEVQALVVSSQLAMPRRVGRGIELNRIQVLTAVLQKHCRLPLGSADVFLSAAGGFTIREPAVDLGLAVAIASSQANKALPKGCVFIGEVGLLGEIRSVSYLDRRVKEAKRLGFTRIYSRQSHTKVRDVLKELQLI